jgi:hypothetical protein
VESLKVKNNLERMSLVKQSKGVLEQSAEEKVP